MSKGAQTNFNSFAEYIDEQWNTNEEQFNERYFQTTAALILLFQYLEKTIPNSLGMRVDIVQISYITHWHNLEDCCIVNIKDRNLI